MQYFCMFACDTPSCSHPGPGMGSDNGILVLLHFSGLCVCLKGESGLPTYPRAASGSPCQPTHRPGAVCAFACVWQCPWASPALLKGASVQPGCWKPNPLSQRAAVCSMWCFHKRHRQMGRRRQGGSDGLCLVIAPKSCSSWERVPPGWMVAYSLGSAEAVGAHTAAGSRPLLALLAPWLLAFLTPVLGNHIKLSRVSSQFFFAVQKPQIAGNAISCLNNCLPAG